MKVLMALAGAVALMLTGCGGGGSKGGGGSAVVREQVRTIVAAADSFTISDATLTAANGSVSRHFGSCRGTTCTALGVTVVRSDALQSVSETNYTSEGVYRGVNMARGYSPPQEGVSSNVYGGWLNYHLFQIEEATGELGGDLVGANIMGRISGSTANLARATYTGVMAGMNSSGTTRTQYRGDVRMEYDGSLIDVSISNILNRSTNSLDGRTLGWTGLGVSGNTFGVYINGLDYIRGKFFGPNAEEAGAVFEQQGITGAFGSKR